MTEAEWREIQRQGIATGDRCALCGAKHDQDDGARGWEGWEVNAHTQHQRCLPDKPEHLCHCERKSNS